MNGSLAIEAKFWLAGESGEGDSAGTGAAIALPGKLGAAPVLIPDDVEGLRLPGIHAGRLAGFGRVEALQRSAAAASTASCRDKLTPGLKDRPRRSLETGR